ncbi:MAG: ABC transporter permease [Dethiobacteria bacterium]
MINYLCRRFLQIVPVLFLITLIVFCLVYVAGDPVSLMLPLDAPPEQFEALRSSLGLDRPLPVQYLSFLSRLARGDFGESFRYRQPALDIVLERIPATLELALVSMIFATIISIPMGIWSATRKDTVIDIFITGLSVLGKAMPGFWLGIMLILLFAVNTQIFPVSGRGTLMHLVLPALTLSVSLAAEMTRLTRSSIIEILSQDYIRTARSKGVNNFSVICKHAFKNCLIPLITIMAVQTSQLVGGALVIEAVFAWPGLGQLIVQAANARDMAILQAAVFIVALMVICINFLADILYTLVDPRVTLK